MVNDWKDDAHKRQALEAMLKFHHAEGRPPTEEDVPTPSGRRAGMPARFALDRIFSNGVNGWPTARRVYDEFLAELPKEQRPVTRKS
jgi:hypothetical protein